LSVVKLPEIVEYLSKPSDFMQAKPRDRQQNLYEVQLEFLFDSRQPLMHLPQVIDWSHFDETFGNLYSEGQDRPAKPTRLMVGLHYLKHAQDLCD
jgi:transposase, IS5 family